MYKQVGGDLVDDESGFGGWHGENIISATYTDGKFSGDSFFDGFNIYSQLLNFFVDCEKKLTNGMRSNVKAHNLFDCYEAVVALGTMETKKHYGEAAFQRQLRDFRRAGFDEIFLDKMQNYSSADSPSLRQWSGYNRHFLKRPMQLL